jgi:hypothetical protein
MSTWIITELGTDFTEDFEDSFIDYIFTKWSIFDPAKGANKITNDNTKIRFHAGHLDYRSPYEISILSGRTKVDDSKEIGGHLIICVTDLTIFLRMQRRSSYPNWIQPQLGYMEREIQRITRHFKPYDVPGIKDFYYDDSQRLPQRNNEFAASNWECEIYGKILYEKRNIEP